MASKKVEPEVTIEHIEHHPDQTVYHVKVNDKHVTVLRNTTDDSLRVADAQYTNPHIGYLARKRVMEHIIEVRIS